MQVSPSAGPVLGDYGFVALVLLMTLGLSLLALAAFARRPKRTVPATGAWAQYRFGYPVYALIFLAFDMEMIFMYPWAVVFADIGVSAFLDMLVFIALLSAGIAYAWGMGGLRWE
ncbi:NADH-quinone oxidoreductase subunit A [Methylobacterium durans]|uniref:NADH-quinone oxidoreductase subunit n=1 Tax=Methylobacterium durans TaxID=2202825 RepID=A0A2U8WAA2_9HYPH|nr:NADH-quinone oxidoreductase subunit A [Methylobacterium durans]AWN42538.1 NADH-quinone oxidoreductase subunit I [Methylobacterium durans]